MLSLIYVCMLTVSDPARGMAARLQLQVPACRLFEQSCGSESKDHINYNHLLTKQYPTRQITTCCWKRLSVLEVSSSQWFLTWKSHTSAFVH